MPTAKTTLLKIKSDVNGDIYLQVLKFAKREMTQLRQNGTICSLLITYMMGSMVIKKKKKELRLTVLAGWSILVTWKSSHEKHL